MKHTNPRASIRPTPGEEENETSDLDAKPRSTRKPKSTSRARKVHRGPGGQEKL
jgi:hypothetical protein